MFKIIIFVLCAFMARRARGESVDWFDFGRYLESDFFLKYLNQEKLSENCSQSFQTWRNGIEKKEIWALQMLDSITKFPDGLLLGRMSIPGQYDECVETRSEHFNGKHCMVQFKQLGRRLKDLINPIYTYGVCLPSTCLLSDINNIISDINELNIISAMNVTEMDCSEGEFPPLRTEDYVAIGVVGFFLVLALGSTLYDLIQRFLLQKEKPHQLLISFSLYTNLVSIFQLSRSAASLKCLYGIRFLSISWVVLGHSYIVLLFSSPINFIDVPKMMSQKSLIPVLNAFVSVDTFFFLSGLLVCVVFFRDISKKGYFDVFGTFIHRYIRVTPPFAMAMFLQSTLVSRMGNGPYWNNNMANQEEFCRSSWWAGILYVQNFVKPKTLCLGQSWYLSADMQMFWISPLVLLPLLWWPSVAPFFLLFLIAAAVTTNFSVSYAYELEPSFSMSIITPKGEDQFEIDYIRSYMRITPWLVGLATGYIVCGLQANIIRLKLSKIGIIIGWTIGLGLLGGSFFSILRFLSYEYSPLEASYYLAFHRLGWSLGLSWLVVACVCGYGGLVNSFLSIDIFQPLAKLSYCMYLIHLSMQNYRIFSLRANNYIEHYQTVHEYFGDMVLAIIFAIPMTLLFEIPFTWLDRYFFQNVKLLPIQKPKRKKKEFKEVQGKPDANHHMENGRANPGFMDA